MVVTVVVVETHGRASLRAPRYTSDSCIMIIRILDNTMNMVGDNHHFMTPFAGIFIFNFPVPSVPPSDRHCSIAFFRCVSGPTNRFVFFTQTVKKYNPERNNRIPITISTALKFVFIFINSAFIF